MAKTAINVITPHKVRYHHEVICKRCNTKHDVGFAMTKCPNCGSCSLVELDYDDTMFDIIKSLADLPAYVHIDI